MMNIILLGPQGSGKGTQAELLVKKFGLQHFEAGKILRSIADSDNQHAGAVKAAINSGNLVPDELVRLIAWDFINKHKNGGFVFDGYPRSAAQYEHLKDMLMKFGKKIDKVIDLEISERETIKRLSKRGREDDMPEAIKKRLELFRLQTEPVIERAIQEGILLEIDGERPIDVIGEDIVNRIMGSKSQ